MIVIKIFTLGGAVLYLNLKWIYYNSLLFTTCSKTIKLANNLIMIVYKEDWKLSFFVIFGVKIEKKKIFAIIDLILNLLDLE